MLFSPIKASREISEKYKRYLKTIFPIADRDYEKQFLAELEHREVFSKGPYLDAVDSFEKGRSLKELIACGILPQGFTKCQFPLERPLYKHQESALEKCLSGENIVVSTGTGSGKTESFLYPVLSDLVKEDQAGTLSPGVRALIIYPMNALANDQTKRLREILAQYKNITFGSYTGQTKQDKNAARAQYYKLNGFYPQKNELICRDDMIAAPPHILITNYAMLEYLLIRPAESTFFQGEYARSWKYIVLDEAHVYSGATGIEVSMLLRRLKTAVGVKKLQYILTSATLGDETQNKEVAEFAGNLCDAAFPEKNVIRAIRRKPDIGNNSL
ncbi:MAG: DEAD/DEAH box helicase, partial [Parasporobacterium sp.]|nr:DEAD/DEAH box helicase [Parasporobacterium sp.]